MLQNILNLEGVTVLGKKEQGSINGGYTCIITTINSDGSSETGYIFGTSDDPNIQTTSAHNACGRELNGGASRCFYDCSHDGLESLQP